MLLSLKYCSDNIYTMPHCASFSEKAIIAFILVHRISDTFMTSLVRYFGLPCTLSVFLLSLFLFILTFCGLAISAVCRVCLIFILYCKNLWQYFHIYSLASYHTSSSLKNKFKSIYSIILFDAIFFLKCFWKFCLFFSHQILKQRRIFYKSNYQIPF